MDWLGSFETAYFNWTVYLPILYGLGECYTHEGMSRDYSSEAWI